MLMASTGHASIQAPQSMQESASTTALPSAMLIALLGHSSTHDSQPVHFALSTSAGMYLPFQIGLKSRLRKHGIITHCRRDYKPKSSPKKSSVDGPRSPQARRRSSRPACAVTPGSLGGFLPQTPIGSRPRVGQREGVWAISWTEPADPATIRIRAGFWACEPRAPPRPSP